MHWKFFCKCSFRARLVLLMLGLVWASTWTLVFLLSLVARQELAMQLALAVLVSLGGGCLAWLALRHMTEPLLQSTEALRESDMRWKLAIEGAGIGVWDWNIQENRAQYSELWKQMLGYDDADVAASHNEWVHLIHPDDKPAVLQANQDHVQGKTSGYAVEYRLRCKDGSYKWVQSRGVVVSRLPDGSAARVIGTHTDIAQRKEAELALLASHAQLRRQLALARAINQVATAISEQEEPDRLLDEAVTIVGKALGVDRASIYDVSVSERRAHGLTEYLNSTEMPVASVKAVYAMSDFASAAQMMAETRQHLVSHAQEVHPCMRADGSAQMLHGSWGVQSLLWYPFGFREEAYYFLALNQIRFHRDWGAEDLAFLDSFSRLISLALAKRAHLLLEREQATELRIAAAAFESQEALMVTDARGVILKVNRAFSRITGYTPQDAVGHTPRILQSGRHTAEFYRNMWHSLMHTGTWSGEIWDRHKDGQVYPKWLAITAVYRADGAVSHYIGSHFDLTEQKAAEAAMLRLNQELRESRQRVRELAAQNEVQLENERKHVAREVHDELGQVLTGLRMGILAMEMRSAARSPEWRSGLQELKSLADHAIAAVRNVAVRLRPAAMELGLVAALEWLGREFNWRTGVPCALDIYERDISVDEARMTVIFRIVQESLTNIARYARPTQVRINLGRRGAELGVEIQDNGVGFDVKDAARRNTFGLLGMRERALALGGHVDIISAPGQGTTIGLTIPLTRWSTEESHDSTGNSG